MENKITEGIDINYSESRFNEEHIMEHHHSTYELAFFINADVSCFIKDTKYKINDGDLLYIHEYDIHRFHYTSNTQYSRFVVNFTWDAMKEVLQALAIDERLKHMGGKEYKKAGTNLKQKGEMESLFRLLHHSCRKSGSTGNPLSIAQAKAILATILARYCELLGGSVPDAAATKKDIQVKSIIDFIDFTYMDEITLECISKKFFLSKFYISRIFKEITGFSFSEYIQYRRVVEAQKMLKSTRKGITEICYDCGFNNLQRFYQVFRKISHVTPAKYRKVYYI